MDDNILPQLGREAGMEAQPVLTLPMSAFFRSVSASFSTTFCLWAAISSLVFSASLQGERSYPGER